METHICGGKRKMIFLWIVQLVRRSSMKGSFRRAKKTIQWQSKLASSFSYIYIYIFYSIISHHISHHAIMFIFPYIICDLLMFCCWNPLSHESDEPKYTGALSFVSFESRRTMDGAFRKPPAFWAYWAYVVFVGPGIYQNLVMTCKKIDALLPKTLGSNGIQPAIMCWGS